MSSGCYDIPALEFRSRSVYTNKMALGAYRGARRPEAAYYVERAIDLLADAAGLDPVEVRRRNFIAPFENSYTTASGERYDTGDYAKALDYAIEVSGFEALRAGAGGGTEERTLPGDRSRLVRRDLRLRAVRERDRARRDQRRRDGLHGHLAHGQGQETSFAQIVADGLGVPMEKIGVNHGDTLNTPQERHHGQPWARGRRRRRGDGHGQGARTARRRSRRTCWRRRPRISRSSRGFRVRGVPGPGSESGEIADKAYSDELPAEFGAGLEATEYFRPDDETFPFGTHVAVVEVFPDTGEVKMVKFVSVDDCGVIISPTLVRGQVHGGVAQGIGQALLEEIVYDASGELVTGTLNDYAIPRAVDFTVRDASHRDANVPEPPWGEGDRRSGDHWLDAGGGKRRDRRTGAVGITISTCRSRRSASGERFKTRVWG